MASLTPQQIKDGADFFRSRGYAKGSGRFRGKDYGAILTEDSPHFLQYLETSWPDGPRGFRCDRYGECWLGREQRGSREHSIFDDRIAEILQSSPEFSHLLGPQGQVDVRASALVMADLNAWSQLRAIIAPKAELAEGWVWWPWEFALPMAAWVLADWRTSEDPIKADTLYAWDETSFSNLPGRVVGFGSRWKTSEPAPTEEEWQKALKASGPATWESLPARVKARYGAAGSGGNGGGNGGGGGAKDCATREDIAKLEDSLRRYADRQGIELVSLIEDRVGEILDELASARQESASLANLISRKIEDKLNAIYEGIGKLQDLIAETHRGGGESGGGGGELTTVLRAGDFVPSTVAPAEAWLAEARSGGLIFEVGVEAPMGGWPDGIHVLSWITPNVRRSAQEVVYVVARRGGREIKVSSRLHPQATTSMDLPDALAKASIRVECLRLSDQSFFVYCSVSAETESGEIMDLQFGPFAYDASDLYLWMSSLRLSPSPEVASIGARYSYVVTRVPAGKDPELGPTTAFPQVLRQVVLDRAPVG